MSQYQLSNSNYTQSTLTTSNSNIFSLMVSYSTNIYFTQTDINGNTGLYLIDITGTVLQLFSKIGNHNYPPRAIGISDDGTQLLIVMSKLVLPSLDFYSEAVLITNPGGSPSQITLTTSSQFLLSGVLSYAFSSFCGVGKDVSSLPFVGQIGIITIDLLNSNYSVYPFTDLTISSVNYPQCSNLYTVSLFSSDYFVTRNCDPSSTSTVELILCSPGRVLTSYEYDGGNAQYLSNYFVALSYPGGNLFNAYVPVVISGIPTINTLQCDAFSTITLQSSFVLPYDPTYGASNSTYTMNYALSGGSGLLRFYFTGKDSGGTYVIEKLFQTSGGSSTGGDPHVKMLNGGEVKFYDERKVLLLSTPKSADGRIMKIWCDSFCIKNLEEYNFKECIPSDQLPILFQNESYLLNIYISIFTGEEEKGIVINTISLKIEGDEEIASFFSPPKKVEGDFSYRANITSPFKFLVSALLEGEIPFDDSLFSIQIIRTRCIHLSDFHISIRGKRDLDEYTGAIITGDITPVS